MPSTASPARRSARPAPEVEGSVQPYRWTREEYHSMIDAGILTPETPVELLDGEIIQHMSPQKSPHATSVVLVADAMRAAFGGETHVRPQLPIAFGDSEPEPDVAVVRGAARDYLAEHPGPSDVLVLVEVADATLRTDQSQKLAAYARAGITEYWIVNLPEACLEVYRDPSGETYRTKTTLAPSDTVTPVAAPRAEVPVADLLP